MIVRKLKDGSVIKIGTSPPYSSLQYHKQFVEHWYNSEGRLHRANGLPSVLTVEGYEAYHTEGKIVSSRYNK